MTKTYSIKAVALILGIGTKTLFNALRNANILHANGYLKNIPRTELIEQGYFSIKETEYQTGSIRHLHQKTTVTKKGLALIEKTLHEMDKEKRVVHSEPRRLHRQQRSDGWPDEVQRMA